jgi:hypothetical protein
MPLLKKVFNDETYKTKVNMCFLSDNIWSFANSIIRVWNFMKVKSLM